MRAVAVGAAGLFVAGVALVTDAVLRGDATVSIVVVLPVVSGGSAEFLVGVVLLVVGFFLTPFVFGDAERPAAPAPAEGAGSSGPSPPDGSAGGGLVLVGPIPFFFGSWRQVSARTRLWVALVGALVLALFVAGVLVAGR